MPRPARYTVDVLLDAAAATPGRRWPGGGHHVGGGARTGAPSGSVYHRFPTRAALCGELWMRTEERFQAGFLAALSTSDDPQQRCVAGALLIVQWCREHPVEAQVLLAGADALGSGRLARRPDQRAGNACTASCARLLAGLPADPDRVNAAVIDIPYAVVRRHLLARHAIPASADAIVEQCARPDTGLAAVLVPFGGVLVEQSQ